MSSVRAALVWAACCWLGTTLLSSCREADVRAHLIRIHGVEQRWEQSERLIVRGSGMPPGMRGQARLVGTLFPPAEPARAVDLRVPCRALDESEALVELDGAYGGVEGDGPFEGQLELSFGAHAGASVVGHLEHASLRIGAAPQLADEFAQRARALQFQRALGIRGVLVSEEGLSIAELSPGGPAARAGIAQGDVVVRIASRPVQLPRDFIAEPSAREVDLEVRRNGTELPFRIALTVAEHQQRDGGLLQLLCFGLMAALGALAVWPLSPRQLWAPRRREYWLALCFALTSLGALLVLAAAAAPEVLAVCRALVAGLLCGAVLMCCWRLLGRTSRTARDRELAPLL